MIEIVKICKKHGELLREQTYLELDKKINKFYYRCKECKKQKDKKYADTRKEIIAEKSKEYKKNNREKIREWAKQDREKNPEKYAAWSKKHKDNNREKIRKQEILRIHKITEEKYDSMFILQNNKCAICNQPETRKGRTKGTIIKLCVDHCHKTGEIRGLLCHACNTALGKFKDSIELMQKAIKYLLKDN